MLLVSDLRLLTGARGAAREQDAWQGRTRLHRRRRRGTVVLLLAGVGWKAVNGEQVLSAEEIRSAIREFYAWYKGLPVVPVDLPAATSRARPTRW